MTREQKYTEQLRQIGIYHPAFDPEIHTLAMLEREHQRTVKTWNKMGSPIDSPVYLALERQRRDILAHRDALGLTPRGLKRLKPALASDEHVSEAKQNIIELLRTKYASEA